MALRGIRRTLRSAQRIAPSAVQGLAEALHAASTASAAGELGLIEVPRWDGYPGYPGWLGTSNQPRLGCHPFPGTQASLCVNELARKKSTIDFAEVPQETWEQIVRSCVQIMPMLPGSHDVALPVGLHVLLRYGYTIGVSIYQPISPI